MSYPIPDNENERLAALATYQVMDTPPEFEQDALTEIAAEICGYPVALITLLESDASGSSPITVSPTSPSARAR